MSLISISVVTIRYSCCHKNTVSSLQEKHACFEYESSVHVLVLFRAHVCVFVAAGLVGSLKRRPCVP
jgi:hypothetical protein